MGCDNFMKPVNGTLLYKHIMYFKPKTNPNSVVHKLAKFYSKRSSMFYRWSEYLILCH